MADRTLRRAYSAANGTKDDSTNTDGREPGSESNGDIYVGSAEPNVDNDGGDVDGGANAIHGSVGVVEVDPAEFDAILAGAGSGSDSGNDSGTGKRKYTKRDAGSGRKPGRPRTSKGSPPTVDAIVLLHTMASVMLKTPELVLEKDEAQKLCDGLAELQKHFPIPVPNEKTIAIMSMVAIAGQVYGTRIMAVNMRKKMERAQRNANVTQMPKQNPAQSAGAGMG
jgi:hypothetical protein